MKLKRELIEAFFTWLKGDQHKEREDIYAGRINLEYLNNLTKEDFLKFFFEFTHAGGMVQSGGERFAGQFIEIIKKDYDGFRSRILETFKPGLDLDKWLEWASSVQFFTPSTATIFLNRVNKNAFVIVNKKSIDGLQKLGFTVPSTNNIRAYKPIESAETALLRDNPELENYFKIDALMHFIVAEDEGKSFFNNELDMDYFNLAGFRNYAPAIGQPYDSQAESTKWYLDTRSKLEYLVSLLKLRLGENIGINYSERPNAQAGRGQPFKLKEYILTGFSPDNLYPDGELFIKMAFHTLSKNPIFDIEFDINYKLENKPFKELVDKIKEATRKRIPVDSNFPNDWESLLITIQDNVKKMINDYRNIAGGISVPIVEEDHFDLNDPNKTSMNSLNIILYGPPGTGKTYHMLEMIKNMRLIESGEGPLPLESFVKDINWWQVVALALIEMKSAKTGDLLDNELVRAKFNTANVKNRGARMWGTLQTHTVDDCPNVKTAKRLGIQLFFKEVDSTWRLNDVAEAEDILGDLINSYRNFKSKTKDSLILTKKYSFTTCHQSLGYEDFIEGIKPIMVSDKEEDVDTDTLSYDIKPGLFYKACDKAANLAGYEDLESCLFDTVEGRKAKFAQAVTKKNLFVFFMDEINRCNVASVFGELITLIEVDKRLGAENEIADIELPYSKKKFGVPLNLMIVGTMNTADRSVESLDTALRRRFDFDPKLPKPDLLKENMKEINLGDLLSTINLRLEALLDKDHTIGHAWLWDVKDLNGLRSVFSNKILPLLQEFFYNDYEKIALVLGDKFVKEQILSGRIFAKSVIGKDQASEYDGTKLFTLNPVENLSIEDFNSILQ